MVNSIRWKLLAWYTAIVAVLMLVYGILIYWNVWRLVRGQLELELRTHALALAAVVIPTDDDTFNIELDAGQIELYRNMDAEATYYRIWNDEGQVVDSSHPELPIARHGQPGVYSRGDMHEVVVAGPAGTSVLVGRAAGAEHARLRTLLGTCLVMGLVVVGLMLAGGWFLTGRALAPIDRITRVAAAVSASRLSERIDAGRMELELAELARTMNSAFDRLQGALDKQLRFTADASHELRTPLSMILAQTDLTLMKPRCAQEYQAALTTVRQSTVRMKEVVERLLKLARADVGDVPLRLAPCRLAPLVAECCQMLKPLADQKRLDFSWDLQDVAATADHVHVAEAVTNLVSNAIQHNVPGRTVRVRLFQRDDDAMVEVSDTGPGIPEADQPFVFDRFYRVARGRTVDGTGSGLGLAVTSWIAQAHGGDVSLVSRPGEPTRFTLRLPLNATTVQTAGADSALS